MKFSLALQACNKKNYFLCLKFVEERHWEKSIYSKHASFLKAWILYKQRQFAAAKNIWISLSRYKNEFQIKILGSMRKARVLKTPAYDPNNKKLKS